MCSMEGFTMSKFEKVVDKMLQSAVCVMGLALVMTISISSTSMVKAANDDKVVITDKTEQVPFGWKIEEGKVYYLDENNVPKTGFQYIDNEWYLFYQTGELFTGWITLGDRTLYFDESGKLQTKECLINGKLYKFLPTGDFISGWYEYDGKKFYKDEYGYDKFGFINVNGKLYYVTNEGLQIGEIVIDEVTRYTDSEGRIYTGDRIVNGKHIYYDATGVYLYGWKQIEDAFYYQDQNGVILTGKQSIDGKDYYFDNNGVLQVNTIIGMYSADAQGVLTRLPITLETLDAALDEILLITGKDITAISNYAGSSIRYKYMEKMATREEMAVYALNNRRCSCYYYEALCGLLLERAGYEVITIHGKGFVYPDHYWSLVKTTRNGIEGWYHVDSLKKMNIKTDAEMVANGFKWTHSDYPATP